MLLSRLEATIDASAAEKGFALSLSFCIPALAVVIFQPLNRPISFFFSFCFSLVSPLQPQCLALNYFCQSLSLSFPSFLAAMIYCPLSHCCCCCFSIHQCHVDMSIEMRREGGGCCCCFRARELALFLIQQKIWPKFCFSINQLKSHLKRRGGGKPSGLFVMAAFPPLPNPLDM